MATINEAINHLKHNETPYWWLFSGSQKVGQYTKNDNLPDSINHLEQQVSMLPSGNYRIKSTDRESNHAGALNFNFTTANATNPTGTSMQPATTNNVYGVPDAVYAKIQNEARQNLMMEQMHGGWSDFIKEWPEYKKKIDFCYKELSDDDDDGTPNFLEMGRKLKETTDMVGGLKSSFSNTGFRL